MIRCLMVIAICALLVGCVTTQRTNDQSWEISLRPLDGGIYEFEARLHKSTINASTSTRNHEENVSQETIFIPAIRLSMNDREQISLGIGKQPANLEADVTLSETNNQIAATYRVMARHKDGKYESCGKIILSK